MTYTKQHPNELLSSLLAQKNYQATEILMVVIMLQFLMTIFSILA